MKHTISGTKRSDTRRRRRGTARLFVLGAAFMASTAGERLATPLHAQQQDRPGPAQPAAVRFEIAAASIEEVVRAFEAVTGIPVTIVNEMIRDLPSPGVAGLFTPQQAI